MTTQLHLPTILFGQQERTLFRVNGVDSVWFQDVWYGAASGNAGVLRVQTKMQSIARKAMTRYLKD